MRGSSIAIRDSVVAHNSASDGGGVFGFASRIEIVETAVSGNSATIGGA